MAQLDGYGARRASAMGRRHPRAICAGVCAMAGDLSGIPTWCFRLAAGVALLNWFYPVAIAYAVTALALQTRFRHLLPVTPARAVGSGSAPGAGIDMFAGLERRLARVEAAVMSDELRLRQGFRDLGEH